MKYALGIDIGGTNIKALAVTPKGRVFDRNRSADRRYERAQLDWQCPGGQGTNPGNSPRRTVVDRRCRAGIGGKKSALNPLHARAIVRPGGIELAESHAGSSRRPRFE